MKKIFIVFIVLLAAIPSSYAQENEPIVIQLNQAEPSGVANYCIDVYAENFENIIGIQFALDWEQTGLSFRSLENVNSSLGNLSLDVDYTVRADQIRFVLSDFTNFTSRTISPSDPLFTICFEANQEQESARISFSDRFKGEAVRGETYESIPVIGEETTVELDNPLIAIEDLAVSSGEEVCLPIVTERVDSLYSFDLYLEWDTTALTYTRIEIGESNMDTSFFQPTVQASTSSLIVNWQNEVTENVLLPYTATLLAVCYEAIAEQSIATVVSLKDNSTAQKWENDAPALIPIDFNDGIVEILYTDTTLAKLSIGDTLVAPGESFCVPMVSEKIERLTGLQFSIEWDPEVIAFDELKLDGSLASESGAQFNATQNTLAFAWFESSGRNITFENSEAIMELCFTASADFTTETEVGFTGDVPFEAIRNDEENIILVDVQRKNGVITVIGDSGEVLPGDTNLDTEVSHYDLLNIGLGYGFSGPVRPNASIEFFGQSAENWGVQAPTTTVDLKHVDTDGNGFIDSLDVEAIERNWFSFPTLIESEISGEGVPFFVESDTVELSVTNVLPVVLGTEADSARGIYGIAFSVYYTSDSIMDEEVSISADNSWLGTLGQDLIMVQRFFPDQNRIDVALTRIDQQPASGFGEICALTIVMEDVILFNEKPDITFTIDHFMMIGEAGRGLAIDTWSNTAVIQNTISDTETIQEILVTRIYPNPTTGNVFVESDAPVKAVVLRDAFGRAIETVNNTNGQIDLSSYSSGLYYLEIQTAKGVAHQSIIIK